MKLFFAAVFVFAAVLSLPCEATTDPLDLVALQDMYYAMNMSEQLKGWKAVGGDPCGESWTGIECSNSSVIHIKLHGLGLKGLLGGQLSNLHSLKILDVSLNSIEGEIPFGLPPHVTHLNLSSNRFLLGIPHSLSSLSHLRHLNLSHNLLAGPVGSVFDGLQNLKEMDLSYNKFAGDLPSSFASLTNLSQLYLQNNEFTGSVIWLAKLQLTDLNIQENHFSGIIPEHFQTIPNLWMGGNKFHVAADSPPWKFPFDNLPNEPNITSPPTAQSSAIEKKPSLINQRQPKRMLSPAAAAFITSGTVMLVCLVAIVVAVHNKRISALDSKSLGSSNRSMYSIPISSTGDQPSIRSEDLPLVSFANSPPMFMPRSAPSVIAYMRDRPGRSSFARNSKMPASVKKFTLAELHKATNNFSVQNFLGEGSLGSVFKAELPDGQVLAVKSITTVSLSLHEEEKFLDVVCLTSRLKHPNIVSLVGYCAEHGEHLLVYEYVRDLTLETALHCEFFMPLTWGLRIQIAVAVAQALDYMHSLSPPVAHCNLKAANILLNDELMPQLCDCGLSVMRPLSSNSVKLKASEMAIIDCGYIAPEQGQLGVENIKADVYAFGVLLLELLTGKRPFDSERPSKEQSLVQWASCRLHDGGSLEDMVDPGLRRSISPKSLSRYADIVTLCIQPEKTFRPLMSEIVEALSKMPKPGTDGVDGDGYERSFRSTHTRFLNSPDVSLVSASEHTSPPTART